MGSVATKTGNPATIGRINEGSIGISKEAATVEVNLQMAEWCHNITATNSLVYTLTVTHNSTLQEFVAH